MNKIYYLIAALIIGVILYILAPILTPFLVGAILAYLGNPLVGLLMRLKLPRLASVIIVFLGLFLVLTLLMILLVPLIQNQIVALTNETPLVIDWLQNNMIPTLKDYFGVDEVINVNVLKATFAENWTKAGGAAAWVGKSLLHSGFAIVELIATSILVLVVTFYLLLDWDAVLSGLRSLLPRSVEPTVIKLAQECNDVISAFFRGQLLVMLSLGIIYSVGLTLSGLKVGLVIGLVSGLLCIVPYLGFITGITAASIAAYVQFGTWTPVIFVWITFMVGQMIESTLLTPKLVGGRIGLHPVAVIFAVLTGGKLFGFFGVLLALPVASVVMVLMRFLNQRYQQSQLYQ